VARYRIRDRLDAQLVGMLFGFAVGLIADWLSDHHNLWPASMSVFVVVGFPIVLGFAARWGWSLRRRYRQTRPSYDPLASLRPKG
jgi:cytochrome b561